MSTRTVYTATVTVPVYASWRCHKCNEINTSMGQITYSKQESSGALRASVREEARTEAERVASLGWISNAENIIFDPRNHALQVRNNLSMVDTKCKKCMERAAWDKDPFKEPFDDKVGYLGIALACVSGMLLLLHLNHLIVWILLAVSGGMIMFSILHWFISNKQYKELMATLPDQYMPVIGSKNKELLDSAAYNGRSIPTPQETIDIVLRLPIRANEE